MIPHRLEVGKFDIFGQFAPTDYNVHSYTDAVFVAVHQIAEEADAFPQINIRANIRYPPLIPGPR